MKLDQLQHMVAIVEHGSLRSAARRLNMPQPALTRSIRALEKDLGCTLFLRASQGMALTPMGRLFHQRASAVVHELRRARDEITQGMGDDQGAVMAGLSIMPHVGMLPRALPAFRARYPGVRLQLIEGLFPDLEERLRTGSIDFYLGAAPRQAPAPGLVVQKLFDNTRTVVCRQGHALARVRSLKALADADWATTSIDYIAEHDLQQLFAQYGLPPPRVMLQARTALSLMVALAHSDMLAMLPVQWSEFHLTRNALHTIKVRELLPAPSVVLVTRQGLPMTPAAEFLCDVLMREAPAPVQDGFGPRVKASNP